MAKAKLQIQYLTLHFCTITHAANLECLGEAFGHSINQILHQCTLHTPIGARFLWSR